MKIRNVVRKFATTDQEGLSVMVVEITKIGDRPRSIQGKNYFVDGTLERVNVVSEGVFESAEGRRILTAAE
jgi:hypothetical protein